MGDVTFLSLGQVEELWDEVAIAKYQTGRIVSSDDKFRRMASPIGSPSSWTSWPTQHRDRRSTPLINIPVCDNSLVEDFFMRTSRGLSMERGDVVSCDHDSYCRTVKAFIKPFKDTHICLVLELP